ncbi:hypothetical protein D3C72_2266560 [compost metagenome]
MLVQDVVFLLDVLGLLFAETTVGHQGDVRALISQGEGRCFGLTPLGFVLLGDAIDRLDRVRVDVGHLIAEVGIGPETVTVVAVGIDFELVRVFGGQRRDPVFQ